MRKVLLFFFEASLAGLAFAFILLLLFRPDILGHRQLVTIEEARTAVPGTRTMPIISYADAVQVAAPTVVNVYTAKVITQRSPFTDDPFLRRFFGPEFSAPRQRLENSLGSGVVVNAAGYILTNNHVIADADEIQVALTDGRSAPATVVGTDPESDLALLNVHMGKLPAIVFGQSETLRVGDVVLAIGNPYGVGQTVTQGIVSAIGRQQLGISTFENFIQTDAAINPGNSGGALINTYGQLIGINTAIFSRSGGSQGIGFAIPTSLAKNIMQQIVEHGRVIRGWLGIETQDVTPDLAESFGLKNSKGAIVANVLPDGPAQRSGLKQGDVLIGVNDTPVRDAHGMVDAISALKPGTHIQLQVFRAGKDLNIEAVVGERPKPRLEE